MVLQENLLGTASRLLWSPVCITRFTATWLLVSKCLEANQHLPVIKAAPRRFFLQQPLYNLFYLTIASNHKVIGGVQPTRDCQSVSVCYVQALQLEMSNFRQLRIFQQKSSLTSQGSNLHSIWLRSVWSLHVLPATVGGFKDMLLRMDSVLKDTE